MCTELERRGFHAIHGDRVLAYQGDPETGEQTPGRTHAHHIWDVAKVAAAVADQDAPVTFFCGGSRNHAKFLDLFDGVFILEVDLDTLLRRIDQRPDKFGATPEERELIVRLHRTKEDIPEGIRIDATGPVASVVDEILRQVGP